MIIQGTRDNCQPFERGLILAELTGARFVPFEGAGHIPNARHPVRVNELIYEHAGGPPPPPTPGFVRPGPRALLVSSPIGLGHAWRDVAIARALRERVPGLQVEWLAQPPVTTVLEACGESIHPASGELAAEARHVDSMMGEHELHAFHMLRRMDEISVANFMVFHDLVRQEHFDLWIADEGWEIDHFLYENPGLKTTPYVWMTDFVGLLPMVAGDEREAFLTADYNAEMIEHVENHPGLRNLSVFIGNDSDIVAERFGPGMPSIRDWTRANYQFSGYVLPFDPRDLQDRASLRRELGFELDRTLIVATVGGSAVGVHLLRRIAQAFEILHAEQPETEMLLVCGPRIDPAQFPAQPGMRVAGYVHDLFKTLACCDLAVVQAGLSTTMELIANRRPFIHIPLRNHFEQNFHVSTRIRRYGAPPPTPYEEATPRALATQMRERLRTEVDYGPVETDGASRAAQLIAPVFEQGALRARAVAMSPSVSGWRRG
jgi:UDP:flavonoid glycosyltransferase YjiC (YdhE family)